jgi:tetratricopeptide (TPR) repeat protein
MLISFPAIGGALLSLLLSSQPAQLPVLAASPELRKLVQNYRALVEKYRLGDAGAVDEAIALPRGQLESILKLIFAVEGKPWATAGELRVAAMMHTDAVLQIADPDTEDGPRRRHLGVASRLLHESSAPDNPFVARWYFAVSRALRERVFLQVAEDLLEHGRARVPGNPTILFESASVAQTRARGYSVMMPQMGAGVPRVEADSPRNVQRRSGLLKAAAGWLREALDRDAALLAPRLHLGRVETLRANEKDALVHLERVLSDTKDPAAAYLAALFSGAAHERLRRPEAAEASYRQAIERYPAGQAAYIALSEILQRSGKTDESRAVLLRLLEAKPGSVAEPWWWYLVEPPGVADERLAALRREARS